MILKRFRNEASNEMLSDLDYCQEYYAVGRPAKRRWKVKFQTEQRVWTLSLARRRRKL